MSLKLRLKFDGKCPQHPRYNPQKDPQPSGPTPCAGCDDLYVIHLYSKIIAKRAEHLGGVSAGDVYDYTFKPQPKPESEHKEPAEHQTQTTTVEAPATIEGETPVVKEDAPVAEAPKRKRGRPKKNAA